MPKIYGVGNLTDYKSTLLSGIIVKPVNHEKIWTLVKDELNLWYMYNLKLLMLNSQPVLALTHHSQQHYTQSLVADQ